MEYSIYIDTATKRVFSGIGLKAPQPVTPGVLQTHLLLRAYFFDSTAATPTPALLSNAATFRVGLKPATDPTASPLIYLKAPSDTGADHYDFEWSAIDSAALRSLLGKLPFADCNAELSWTIGSTVERVSWSMQVINANLRTTDGPPNPVEPESDTFVRERALCYDAAQTLTDAQRMRALQNLGITIVNGALRLLDANGDAVHVGLNSGEPTAP